MDNFDNNNYGYDNNNYDNGNNGNMYADSANNVDSFGNPIQDMGGYNAPQNQGSSTLAIVSLICGIAGIVISCCCCLGPAAGIAAIITGAISIKKQNPGKGMAIAGIITGAVSVVLYLVLMIISLASGASTSFMEGFMEGMEGCIRFF